MLAGRVQPAFGRTLFPFFRDDAGGVRPVGKRDFEHFLGRGHFQVERQIGRFLDAAQVCIADVAAVFAQMRRNAVTADAGNDFRRAHRVGMVPSARVADGRDVVDVDPEAQGAGQAARLPGLVTGTAASSAGSSSSA